MLMFIFLIVCAIAFLIYFYLTWNNDYWKIRNVPGPKPSVFFGNFKQAILQKRNLVHEIDAIFRKYRKEGAPFVGVFMLRTPQLMILDSELVKDIFVRKFNNFHDNEFGGIFDKEREPIFGRNPFFLNGNEWKDKRAEITPAFSPSRIKAMFPLIKDVGDHMVQHLMQQWKQNDPEIGVDVRELSASFTTDVVSSCIFGCDAKSFSDNKEDAVIRKMGRKIMDGAQNILLYILLTTSFPLLGKLVNLKIISTDIENFFTQILQDAVQLRNVNKSDRQDYLEYLLQLKAKKDISDVDMTAHAMTFFTDGFETSSLGIMMTLYEIAKHKDVQDKLRLEINENSVNGEMPFEKLLDLPYLDAVFAEGQRLYPAGPMLTKKCTIPTNLVGIKDHTLHIEEGMLMLVPVYSIHLDPEYYEDPQTFNPDRFSLENGGVKKYEESGVFLGFGAGPRICLGKRFAKAQVKVALSELVQHFEISVSDKMMEPLDFDPKEFLLQPIGGVWLNFKPITN